MGVIYKLEKHVAELIAAGEVVERPASVVKEVAENAIDAGATAIIVEIKNGGVTFIRVTDNGGGIYRDDVKNAFLSHATSKVRHEDDLDGILTMGFRGEALASIAAVARVELLTRREGELEGTRYVIEGSQEQENCAAGCPKGVTIIIRDLFYNTPARLKFIKKDISEANAVAGVLDKLAVSYPEISFQFIKDGELKLNTPGDGKLLSAVYAVYGGEFAKGLAEVHYQSGALCIDGLVSKPENTRANRSMQNFFINKRYVKSRTCAAALEEAYQGEIMVGKFPACILNLTIPPHTVDVNVHPAKIEVRFENEKVIFDLVYFGVKNLLSAVKSPTLTVKRPVLMDYAPQPEFEQQRMSAQAYQEMIHPSEKAANNKNHALSQENYGTLKQPGTLSVAMHDDNQLFSGYQTKWESELPASTAAPHADVNMPQSPVSTAPSMEETVEKYKNARLVGELFSTYILLENGDAMLVIDKHAAHERILFNRMKSGRKAEFCQSLLVPQTVTLDKAEYAAALENLEVLAQCGFEAEDFGGGAVLVRSAPMWLSAGEIGVVVSEVCAGLKSCKQDPSPQMLDNLYHSVACRAAVKGGEKSGNLELSVLVALLEEDGSVQHCPHGRPVCMTVTRHELEKQFGRV